MTSSRHPPWPILTLPRGKRAKAILMYHLFYALIASFLGILFTMALASDSLPKYKHTLYLSIISLVPCGLILNQINIAPDDDPTLHFPRRRGLALTLLSCCFGAAWTVLGVRFAKEDLWGIASDLGRVVEEWGWFISVVVLLYKCCEAMAILGVGWAFGVVGVLLQALEYREEIQGIGFRGSSVGAAIE
ncbi:hypothetical protein CC1G_12031 [Coprinopsis cinerea okayama7|uniref:Uncharacterized protein n=1 Tax=Coprinopsis cinerea (strain Okayama-7 / 130 / ATCC MYA-4618 / FGSC 9003) TaxID=240176 RepID=A8P8H2_COPC7|nr:hypothetical protein CC1G_12031 [Coprinopsis cinerea okayama7\|eukprot:XP_001839568.1 hypothetical protein CC1G_12031 [Coprinopsis cinerea okayama7\